METKKAQDGVEFVTTAVFLERHKGKFGRNSLYNWLAENKLPHIQIGRKILIPENAFERMLAAEAKADV